MSTQLLIKKLNKDVEGLKNDVREMKRFLLAPLDDPEGEYRASFVKRMLARSHARGRLHRFTGKESFLNHVRSEE